MLFSLLRELSEAFGPAGFEDEIRSIIRCHIERVVDSVEVTPLGNLIARKRGSNARHTLLVDAHMDEVGFMVTVVEPSGFLRFAPLGGWDARVIPGHRMTIRATDGSKHLAVVGSTPPHATSPADRDKPLSIDQLYLDVACPDSAAVEALGIRMGSPVVPCTPYVEMGNDAVCSKAFDDRAGCAVLCASLIELANKTLDYDLVACFSVQEETGGQGAITAGEALKPDAAIVLECTTATDTPGMPLAKVASQFRKGPAITLADSGTIVPEKMVRFLEWQARTAEIPWQFKTPRIGGTNARLLQISGCGVPVGVVAAPCRYIHSPAGILHKPDLKHTMTLALRTMENAGELFNALEG